MSLVADGHPNQEDICGWAVGTDNARRCEELLRAVRAGEYPILYCVCLKSIEAISSLPPFLGPKYSLPHS